MAFRFPIWRKTPLSSTWPWLWSQRSAAIRSGQREYPVPWVFIGCVIWGSGASIDSTPSSPVGSPFGLYVRSIGTTSRA